MATGLLSLLSPSLTAGAGSPELGGGTSSASASSHTTGNFAPVFGSTNASSNIAIPLLIGGAILVALVYAKRGK